MLKNIFRFGGVVMSFLDKVKEKASVVGVKVKETGTSISDKSKLAVEKQKIKSAISKENVIINKKYTEIGKKYVEVFGDAPSEEFLTLVNEVKESKNNIAKLDNQLIELEDFVVCSCGARVPKGVAFCSNCGSAVVVPEEPTPAPVADAEVVDAEPEIPPVETAEVTPTTEDNKAE
jgi:uncharacterized protein YutD